MAKDTFNNYVMRLDEPPEIKEAGRSPTLYARD